MVSPNQDWPLSARRCDTGFQAAPDRKLEGVTIKRAETLRRVEWTEDRWRQIDAIARVFRWD